MFDLFRSREKSVRILLTVMLGLVALSMVTYLIPGSGSGYNGSTGDKTLVAQVGKEEVTAQEVSRNVQNMTRNRQLPPELLSIYVPQIVQQMINERAMAYEAGRLGIKVSSEETDSAIVDTLPPQLIKDGKVDGATLSAMLQQQGLTLADLKTSTARQLLVNKLQQIVGQGVIIAPADIDSEYRKRNDKVKLEYVLLAPARYQPEAEPAEAEVKAYYDSHKADFKVPEKRSFAIIVLDPARIAAGNMPTDAQVQSEYNSRRNDFMSPERVKVRHILLKSDASNDAVIKAKAEGLLKQIQAGGDFAKLAKENSEDPGSKDQGGEVGWMVRGQMVPEFEKAGFAMKVGETSGLVKTTYGYHILQVEAHEQAHLQTLDEVKGQLVTDIQKRVASQQMQGLSDKVVAQLRKDPAHPETAAALAGTTVIQANNIQSGDPIPGVGPSKEFTDATAALRKGEVMAGPVVLQDGKAVIAAVTDVQPAHGASFDEARTEARSKATQEKLQKILADKSNELLTKTQSMGGDLAKAAKSMNIEVKTSPDVDRQSAIESVGTASSITDAFTKPVGSLLGPQSVTGGRLVAKIVSKTPADMAAASSQTETLRTEIKQQRARDRAQLFQEGLKDRLKTDGKLKVYQDVINRLVQSYQRS
ncbi:MAG: peptidyl-prolyl cis-trans isomerase [Bryobacterales bacterium]|jgi:peptidyl-prolyl cis-trans isomerase D|nr:peptidyl-prolyl cis-trans isomerase [Bryobacterales bacterium]